MPGPTDYVYGAFYEGFLNGGDILARLAREHAFAIDTLREYLRQFLQCPPLEAAIQRASHRGGSW